ncbi:MAG: C39 family peptidase [Armatimonadetes bacterium]|nr:C39 family peptidase [Armatimonadota bacterium]
MTLRLLACLVLLAAPGGLLQVPDVRQSTPYSCGAAALQAVLAYWGVELREDQLMERLGTDPEVGTPPDAILRVARELGLQADLREGLALEDLAAALEQGVPVIVAMQAWRDGPGSPWAEEWDDGHYVVVIGLDAEKVVVEDPSLLGSRGFLPRAEFVERWHDVDGQGRRYVRCGIFLRGTRPCPPPELRPVE